MLQAAVADALGRAEAAAAGAGSTIDHVLRIEERRPMASPPRMMAIQREVAAAETPIALGQIEIRGRVTLTAALR